MAEISAARGQSQAVPHPGRAAAGPTVGLTAPRVLLAFVVSLPLLFSFEVAGLRLSPVRLFLLLAFVPSVLALAGGRAGRIRAGDVFMFAFSAWVVVSLLVNDGLAQLPNAAMTAIEIFGGYALGRILIRNAADFRLMTRIYLGVLVCLLPFAAAEFLTGRMILHEIYDLFGTTSWKPSSSRDRWGFARTMSGFDHPILFGLFCSVMVSILFYVYRKDRITAASGLFLVFTMTLMSLSSAPLLSLAVQGALISWGVLTREKWWPLIALVISAYVVVDLLSNRTPITILINYVTFDPHTAWTRIAQWEYGTAGLMKHPFLGFGMGEKWLDWEKPSWLTPSIDNYWLVIAMRHGLVGIALQLVALACILTAILAAKPRSGPLRDIRTGYVIGVVGVFLVLCTVHAWGAVSVFVMFLWGAGLWMADPDPEPVSAAPAATMVPERGQGPRTSRFPWDHKRHRPTPGKAGG